MMYSALRVVGSLWFAAVILVLMLLALACATVFESMHGAERALAEFYRSDWFTALLVLFSVNVLAAVVVRYPFMKRQLGFVLTHLSLITILIGALVTERYGVEGQIGIAEGQMVEYFTVNNENTLTLTNTTTGARTSMDLEDQVFTGFRAGTPASETSMMIGDTVIEVARYVPDSEVTTKVLNDAPHEHPAVEVSLSPNGLDDPTWVFLNQPVSLGPTSVVYRMLESEEELQRLVEVEAPTQTRSLGNVRVEYQGKPYTLAIESCMENPAPLADTGLMVKVLRYLPHANVGKENKVVNVSARPVNPAIEVEVTGNDKTETRLAFARFPDFQSMHGDQQITGLKVYYDLSQTMSPQAPVEIITVSGRDDLYVRFSWEGTQPVVHPLVVGQTLDTPWPGKKLSLVQKFDRARIARMTVPVEDIRKKRTPAILLKISSENQVHEMWVQRHQSQPLNVEGVPYRMIFGDKILPLGFQVTLEKFDVGYYPGGRRPRSFTSRISIVDPTTGFKDQRIISMNHPTKYGQFNMYQSSYRLEAERAISYLSVARDPGVWIVFAGYIGTMLGMILVMLNRVQDRRQLEMESSHQNSNYGGRKKSGVIHLIDPNNQCVSDTNGMGEAQTPSRPVPVVSQRYETFFKG